MGMVIFPSLMHDLGGTYSIQVTNTDSSPKINDA